MASVLLAHDNGDLIHRLPLPAQQTLWTLREAKASVRGALLSTMDRVEATREERSRANARIAELTRVHGLKPDDDSRSMTQAREHEQRATRELARILPINADPPSGGPHPGGHLN